MSYNFEYEILEAIRNLLKTETDYNVIIQVGEKPNFKEFHAHSIILRCRSKYFDIIFSDKNIERKDGKYLIKKPNISPQAFNTILSYLYTGQFNITNKTGIELLDFMIISDRMMLKNLTNLTEDYIVKNHQRFMQNDPVKILQVIYYYKFVNLQEFYLSKICAEPKILFGSDKFVKLSTPLLEIILNGDDLNLEEIEIWENLIKWGLAQEQVRNQDVTKWNQDDISIFKGVLYKFIPLIRFYEISTRDYFNKIKPYEEILPKELKDDILKSYMVPEYKPIYTPRNLNTDSTDSIMINREHLRLFSNWIDRKKEKVNYKFNLLYRASRDSNTAAAFHAKCDNKGATIVVAKINCSNQIVGGYNPFSWDSSDTNMASKDSFVFTIADKNNIQGANVVYSNGNHYSIRSYSLFGPAFGYEDLFLNYNTGRNIWNHYYNHVHSSYPTFYLPKRMKVDDYEVFQVIKK
ncbi:hypothetical protein RhiirC2_851651 [Rhizophagus irregularis]|uniref:Kelch-like protein 17 n=1 Tax=Rhizophagus irregularis TaxID=588596 RepID=A0A2N1N2R7_9GLOM|nr:hypothetical protein RhiirC2_851651 [Rhizophagus irregularis]